ncbi:hypothetical protein LINPERHAP1_LOCUS21937 [Linum perenne]
MMLNQRGSLSG